MTCAHKFQYYTHENVGTIDTKKAVKRICHDCDLHQAAHIEWVRYVPMIAKEKDENQEILP